MYTRCPECDTVFRLTAAQLAQAEGRVRCGECRHVFGALATLAESPAAARQKRSPRSAAERETDDRAEAVLANDWERDGEFDYEPHPWQELQLGDDEVNFHPEPGLDVSHFGHDAFDEDGDDRMATAGWEREARHRTPRSRRESAARTRAAMGWAVALLLLVLALQGIHYSRAELAVHPAAGPWIVWMYQRLGEPVHPAWPLEAFDLRTISDQQRTADGALEVVADLANRGDRVLPLPLLRLNLLDQTNRPLGTRVFEPADYAGNRARDLLRPNDTLRAQLTVYMPQGEAYGYRLDVCRYAHDGLICDSTL